MCFSCICLFTLILSFFASSWCRGLAAACDCGTPYSFLLTFFDISDGQYSEKCTMTKLVNSLISHLTKTN